MEGIGKEMFEEWMKRLMERIDRLDSIISVLINKEAAGVKYMDGERLYDNQDLCEMLRTSKRSLQRFRSEYATRKSAARPTTRNRTYWNLSAGTWKR